MGTKQSTESDHGGSTDDITIAEADFSQYDLQQVQLVLLTERADQHLLSIVFTFLGRRDYVHASQCNRGMRRIGEMKTARSRQRYYHAQQQPEPASEEKAESESADSISVMSGSAGPTSMLNEGNDCRINNLSRVIEELFCRKYCRWLGDYPSPSTLQLRIDSRQHHHDDNHAAAAAVDSDLIMNRLVHNPLLKHINSIHIIASILYAETNEERTHHIAVMLLQLSQFSQQQQISSLYIDIQPQWNHTYTESTIDFAVLLRQIAPQLEVLSLPESSHRLLLPPDLSSLIPLLSNLKVLSMVPGPPAGILLHLTQLEALRFHGHLFTDKSLDCILDVRTLSLNHQLRSFSFPIGSTQGLIELFLDTKHPGFAKKHQMATASPLNVLHQVDIDEDARAYKPANLTRLIVKKQDHIIHRLPSLTSLEICEAVECALLLTSTLQNGLRDLRLHVNKMHPDLLHFSRYGESRFDLPDLPNLTTLHLKITHEMFSYRMMKDDMMRLFTHVPALTELHLNALPLAFSPFSQLLQQLIHFTLTLHQPLDYMDELYQSLARLPCFRTLELVLSGKYRMLSTAATTAAAVIATEEKKRKEVAEARKKKKTKQFAQPPTSNYSTIIFPLSQSFFLSLIASSTWHILHLRVDHTSMNARSFQSDEPEVLSNEEFMKRQRPTWNPSTNKCDAAIPDLKLILANHANQTERIMLQVNKFRVYYLVGENNEQHQCYGLVKLKSGEAGLAAVSSSPPIDQQQRYGWRQHLRIV